MTLEQVQRRRQHWPSTLSQRDLDAFRSHKVMQDFQGCRIEMTRKLSLPYELLAAAELICWYLLAQKKTIPVRSLQRELKRLGMGRDGKHCRAIITLFAGLGIFRCVDARYHFDVPDAGNEWNRSEGEARQWQPTPGAVIPEDLLSFFPHTVDSLGRARYAPATETTLPEPSEPEMTRTCSIPVNVTTIAARPPSLPARNYM